jgi:alpha-galactosidase
MAPKLKVQINKKGRKPYIMAKITFIGAGSVIFTRNFLSDLMSYPELDGSEICLMDIDEERLRMVDALAQKMVAQENSRMVVTSTLNRREALTNADYVIVTIQVGGYKAWEMDIEIPKKYGVEQSVGDTIGPGGVFRGLRHLAVISDLCKELEEVSPKALILQYSNPMVIICRAIQASSTIRTVGLCHSVQRTAQKLARFVGKPYEELTYLVAGINHMAWFQRLEWKGEDLYPLLFDKLNDPEIYGEEPVRFELLRHFGQFVTESSPHASEYFPYFRKNSAQIEKLVSTFSKRSPVWLGYGRTGGALQYSQTERVDAYYTFFKQQLDPETKIEIKRSHEYGVQIIHSIETNMPRRINGNVANNGAIPNLPREACVEVPCLVDNTGVLPCYVGELPEQLAGLNRTNLNMQELAAQGHLLRDPDLISQAIKLDPLTGAACTLEQVDSMVQEMFEAQAEWLPQFQGSKLLRR